MADYDDSFMESLRLSVLNAVDGSPNKFICLKKDDINLLTCNDETVDLNRAFDDILTTNLDIYNPNNIKSVSSQQVKYLTTKDDEDNSKNMYTSNQAWILLIEKLIDYYEKFKTYFTEVNDAKRLDENYVENISEKLIKKVNDESEKFDESQKQNLINQIQTQSANQAEFQEKIKGKIDEIWIYNKRYIEDKIKKYNDNIDEMSNKFTKEEIIRLENFLSSIDDFFKISNDIKLIEIVVPTLIILKFLGSTNEKMLVDIVDNTSEYQEVNEKLNELISKSKVASGGGKRKKKSRKKNKRSKSKRRRYKKKKYSKRKSKNSNKKNIQKGGSIALIAGIIFGVILLITYYCAKETTNCS